MTSVVFQYLCPRCGHFCDGLTTDIKNAERVLYHTYIGDAAQVYLESGGKGTFSSVILHSCPDGGTGLASIVGFIHQ